MRATIIAASPGVGKSYLGRKHKNVLDLESSPFRYAGAGLEELSAEERKGLNHLGGENPRWPQNYIDALLENIDLYDIVLIPPPHENFKAQEIWDYLATHNIKAFIAVPSIESLETVFARMQGRSNKFIAYMRESYPLLLEELKTNKSFYNIIKILDGEFLEDTLIRLGFVLV